MKFTIDASVLANLLQDLSKAIPAKTAQPILTNYLLELAGELLRVTASDSEIVLRGCVKLDETDATGSSAVPAKLLLDLVKTLPAGPVTIEKTLNGSVDIRWKSGTSSLPVFDPADYIKVTVPKKDEAKTFDTTTDILVKAIGKTLFAVSADQTRPALGGIFFDIMPGVSRLVASDSLKLVCFDIKTPAVTEAASFILPAKAASILKGILPKEQPVKVVFDRKNARFAFGSTEMTARLVDAKFSKYAGVIPTENENILVLGRDELMNILKRMSVVADRKQAFVNVKLSFNKASITAEDIGMSTKGAEEIECDYDGTDIAVLLKAPTVIDVLSVTEADKVEVKIKDGTKAILIQPAESERAEDPYMAIVMPFRPK